MEEKEIERIKELVDDVINSSTKNEAKRPLKTLEFEAAMASSELDGYSRKKLHEVISYAKKASGQPKNKEHWVGCVQSSWYVFKNCASTAKP